MCIIYNVLIFQNESSSDTISSRGKETDFENKIENDRSKRFDYLLQQTEIFSHFMTNTGPKNPSSPLKVKAGRPRKTPLEKKDDKIIE